MVRSGTLCRNATPPPKPEYRVESASPVKDIEWGSLFGSTRFPNFGGQSGCPSKIIRHDASKDVKAVVKAALVAYSRAVR